LASAATAHQRHPNGSLRLAWQAEHIQAVTAIDMDVRMSGKMFIRATGAARVELRDGRPCAVGAILVFDVDDAFAFDIDETITLEVVLDRETSNGLAYYYDHAERRPSAKELRFPESTQRWQLVELVLERARLSNRLLESSDFALAALGANAFSGKSAGAPEIAVCGIRIAREGKPSRVGRRKGALLLEVSDGIGGSPTPARVGLYDARGRLPRPTRSALEFRRWETEQVVQTELVPGIETWPYDDRYVFYIDGSYEAELEAGTYELVLGKGPEYRYLQQQVTIEPGKTTRLELALSRWIDMPAQGWYSGDDHIHVERTPDDNAWISQLMRAEDLHMANLLQMGNPAGYFFAQYAFGPRGHHVVGDHALVSGQESPRTMQLGHTIGLNARRYHHPPEYFRYDATAEAVRRDGGLFGYAHVVDSIAEATQAHAGLALDVVNGLVDFVEIMQGGQLGPELLYDFLNLGFKLTPSAGTDWPYLGLPGSERLYVQLEDGGFSPDAFFSGMKAGRVFVTNGPMLELDVAGHGMGAEVRVEEGESVRVDAAARQNPDLGALERLELVVHGKVVETAIASSGAEELELSFELKLDASAWLAVRAYGKDWGLAHSAPVYVLMGDEDRFWKVAAVPELVAHQKRVLEGIPNSVIDWSTQHEKDSVSLELLNLQWDAQQSAVEQRVRKAIEAYDALLEDASR
jgi:hypothetical protein